MKVISCIFVLKSAKKLVRKKQPTHYRKASAQEENSRYQQTSEPQRAPLGSGGLVNTGREHLN